jgi:5-methylcytosine-specific restriction endonuclease McrA
MGGQSASRRLVWRGRRQAARLGGAGADEATDKASVMSAYGTTRWRNLRASFRRDCELRQLPCGISRQAIDYDLEYPEADSWQADHVLPAKVYPHLFYRRDNLQPAHRRCNSARHADPIDNTWTAPQW